MFHLAESKACGITTNKRLGLVGVNQFFIHIRFLISASGIQTDR
jgi:hypothetical protein